ncbi:MAG: transcription termination factor NusA [bacterium]
METQPFISAIEQICEEKSISKEKVIEAIEMALAAAYKKDYGRKGQNVKVELNPKTGKMKFYQVQLVIDESMVKSEEELEEERKMREREEETIVEEQENEDDKKVRFNPEKHILLDDAKKQQKDIKVGDELETELEIHEDYGRIAAQTAKQVIIQRIREAEREAIFDEYKDKEGQVVSGIIQRIENGNVFLDIGKATGALFPEDQIPNEHYRIGQRLRIYIVEVKKDARGSSISLSRIHPNMIVQLFTLEVPEISSGTVEIKSVAREAGSRSKIAVTSTEEKVDPIGSMIGQRGTRVQAVINELSGEKIDIVEWSDNPIQFISNALSPAKVIDVQIDKDNKEAKVIVPDDQLSLAIGIKGQNARLAAKLTNWKIDISAQGDKENKKDDNKEKSDKSKDKKITKTKKVRKEKKEDK